MDLRIVFMGTPDFAVPSLSILVEHGYQVVGIVTATDKFGGRGKRELIESAVKKYAVSKNIPVLQPANLKSDSFLSELNSLKPNLQVVVAFRMLPEAVWALPTLGTFNLHGSLLPKYRGAAPINWAIINGEKETGVTSFFLNHEIDTGNVIFQEKMEIGPNETAGELHDRMMILGAKTVLKTVQAIEAGNVHPVPQNDAQSTKAPKIFHETCEINLEQPASAIHNFIRGLSPYPAAWTTIDDKTVKILRTELDSVVSSLPPGTFFIHDNKIKVATTDNNLIITELQMQGKKRMTARDFLNGHAALFQKTV